MWIPNEGGALVPQERSSGPCKALRPRETPAPKVPEQRLAVRNVQEQNSWGSGTPNPEEWIEAWERRAAAAAVKDLEACGADEDLEALRAAWSTAAAPGVQKSAPSRLNRRGDVATRRLRTVENLRRVAEGTAPVGEATADSIPGGGCLKLEDARGRGSRAGSRSSSRGPKPSEASGERQPRGPRPHRSSPKTSSPLQTLLDEDDPWVTWERRWAETFEEMQNSLNAKRRAPSRPHGGIPEPQRRQAPSSGSSTGPERPASGFARGRSGYSTGAAPKGQGRGGSSQRPPPGPRSAAGGASRSTAPASRPAPPPGIRSFSAYEEAWSSFESRAMTSNEPLADGEIPWPLDLPTVSGIEGHDSAGDRKRKLRAALLRWHPDKWGPLLSRVREEERAAVAERVQEVTRRILAEKEQYK
eukprot:TRINITY_DN27321_c0_g1_i1.p1 TRINITY_DN27321_c0_g1~~TRINITY_DN27321_c0_g1_i1.p1  ORF type:complete len:444 (+),score=66.21 TRINITY_DN27321_c0_g1_i1:88-1332(+)